MEYRARDIVEIQKLRNIIFTCTLASRKKGSIIMMGNKAKAAVLLVVSAAAVLRACSNLKETIVNETEQEIKATDQPTEEDNTDMLSNSDIKEINVYAYVGDYGRMVNRIAYKVDEITKVDGLTKEDFTIKLGENSFAVKDLNTTGNELILETDDFFYDGMNVYGKNYAVTHYDFNVSCIDTALDFTKDSCTLHTKTLDNFTNGTYKASNDVELPYSLYLPEGAAAVPLMVWEHGGGEVLATSYEGANITQNKGASVWIESGMNTAVLSFQYPRNYSFGISDKPEELKMMEAYNVVKYEFIQTLINNGQVDASRVYISGASSGGGAVLRFLMQYPKFFAAALPICAKDTLIPISEPYGLAFKMQGSLAISEEDYKKCYSDIKKLMNGYDITNVPIWFVQADNDPVCTSYTSKILYDVLNEMGAENNRITMYSDEEMSASKMPSLHSSWVMAFNDPEIIKWVYEQSRK